MTHDKLYSDYLTWAAHKYPNTLLTRIDTPDELNAAVALLRTTEGTYQALHELILLARAEKRAAEKAASKLTQEHKD